MSCLDFILILALDFALISPLPCTDRFLQDHVAGIARVMHTLCIATDTANLAAWQIHHYWDFLNPIQRARGVLAADKWMRVSPPREFTLGAGLHFLAWRTLSPLFLLPLTTLTFQGPFEGPPRGS